jgi:hypothetical protein
MVEGQGPELVLTRGLEVLPSLMGEEQYRSRARKASDAELSNQRPGCLATLWGCNVLTVLVSVPTVLLFAWAASLISTEILLGALGIAGFLWYRDVQQTYRWSAALGEQQEPRRIAVPHADRLGRMTNLERPLVSPDPEKWCQVCAHSNGPGWTTCGWCGAANPTAPAAAPSERKRRWW